MAEIRDADRWHVIKAYAQGDSYATVVSNSVGYASMSPGDYTLSGAANAQRVLTFASGKSFSATASSGPAPDIHFAFVDSTTSRVLYVTDETSNDTVAISEVVTLPSDLTYTTSQTPM